MVKLSDIPTAQIPMPCAPMYDERGKVIIRHAVKNKTVAGIIDEVARIAGYVSAPLFTDGKMRDAVAAVVKRTGAKLALSGSPWKIEKGVFFGLDDGKGELDQLYAIAASITEWRHKLGRAPDWLTFYDEAERITDENRDAVLARTIRLWPCVVDDVGTVAWYNARMVREKDVYPFTHPLTPGPSHCSLYLDDNHWNGWNLAITKARLDPWDVPVVANVILNKWKLRNGGRYNQGYPSIGAEPTHFRQQGKIIRKVGCSAVIVSQCPLLLNGKENPDVVTNWAALVKGMNG